MDNGTQLVYTMGITRWKEVEMVARDVKVMVRLAEHSKNDLQAMAERYGVTVSALCAFVLGQWVDSQKNVMTPLLETVARIATEQLGSQASPESAASLDLEKVTP